MLGDHGVDELVGDLRERLLPTDPFPSALTTFANSFQWHGEA